MVRENAHIARAQVPAPTAVPPSSDSVEGDGWKLALKPGWTLVPGLRPGDFTVRER